MIFRRVKLMARTWLPIVFVAALGLLAASLRRQQIGLLQRGRTQILSCDGDDCGPLPYDSSFGIASDDVDGSEDAVMFNAADADGASWRGFVPVVVWPEKQWFDADGNYLGFSGGHDIRKTTVTHAIESGVQLAALRQRQRTLAYANAA